jgi:hypothetical protein
LACFGLCSFKLANLEQNKLLTIVILSRLLPADQKRTRMKIYEQCLKRFNKNKTDFVSPFITMDETWIHNYTPESKEQSKQWAAPKKARSVPSAGKVMASVFWDAEGTLFIIFKSVK